MFWEPGIQVPTGGKVVENRNFNLGHFFHGPFQVGYFRPGLLLIFIGYGFGHSNPLDYGLSIALDDQIISI